MRPPNTPALGIPRSAHALATCMLAAFTYLAPWSFETTARANDILVTDFNAYGTGTLSGQLAWIGVGGSWAVSGAVNSPQIAANVIGPGVDAGIAPVGGRGRMVRLCTERFANGRTKAWLDLSNSGRWAAASAGGNDVLESRVQLLVPSGQTLPAAFGIMVSKTAIETAGGFVVNGQTGEISLLNGGFGPANRTPTGVTVPFNTWSAFTYRWNVLTGAGELLVNGTSVARHTTTLAGAVYASNLLAATDAAPGPLNAFGYFDDFALAAVAPAAPCTGDLNRDGTRDAADLAILLGAWGTTAGDVSGDGTTDGQDLAALLGGWGSCG